GTRRRWTESGGARRRYPKLRRAHWRQGRRSPPPCECQSARDLSHYVAPCHKGGITGRRSMLKSYFPVVIFILLGAGVGTAFTLLNSVLGPRRPNPVKREPYECGLPSEVQKNFRFGISFYLIAMLFILFDIEVIFLYPVAILLKEFGLFALGETIVFIVLLLVGFVFVWRRGALEWR